MNYYEIDVRKSFIESYKFHIKKLESVFPSYAVKLSNTIRNKFHLIQMFPYLNPILRMPNDDNIYRKVIVDKKYHLIYTIKNKTISILYFSDGRQDPDTYFKSLDIFNSLN